MKIRKRDATTCTKVAYNNRQDAVSAAIAIGKRQNRYSMHSYKCKIYGCNKYHLTSSKK